MIDIHSHIIPKIDDGAKNLDISLKLLQIARDNGTKGIVATPHYYKGFYNFEYNNIGKEVEELKEMAKDNFIDIDIYYVQEICFFQGMFKELEEGRIGTINGTKYILIEFPLDEFSKNIFDEIYELQIRGIQPIIAHPERYKIFKDKPEEINKFIEEGYLFQLNSGSILGEFSKETRKTAEIFLKNNVYSFVGSDAHNLERRTTSLGNVIKALDSIYIDEYNKNGIEMLKNNEIKFSGEKVQKKKKFIFF